MILPIRHTNTDGELHIGDVYILIEAPEGKEWEKYDMNEDLTSQDITIHQDFLSHD